MILTELVMVGPAWEVDGRAQALVGPGLAMPLRIRKNIRNSFIKRC